MMLRGGVKSDKKSLINPLIIPGGKFSTGYYWYEHDPELLKGEKMAMARFFPQFKLKRLANGKLSWEGVLSPTHIRTNSQWFLRIVYDHNHPNNSTYGGSIKIYPVKPNLDVLSKNLNKPIPHILHDSKGHLYLCTSRIEDVKVGRINTSAASALAWAARWITLFELWRLGELSTSQFCEHI